MLFLTNFDPPPCNKLSHFLSPLSLDLDVLYWQSLLTENWLLIGLLPAEPHEPEYSKWVETLWLVVVRCLTTSWHTGRRRLSRIFYIIWPNGSFHILYIFSSLLFSFLFGPQALFYSVFFLYIFFFQSDPNDGGFFIGQTRLFCIYIYIYICIFFSLQLFLFSIITYTVIYNRSNNMWTYLHSDLLTSYTSIIKTIYNYTLNNNLYNVHPYTYSHVYTPNAYDTTLPTLSCDNNTTTVEQVN